MKSFGITDRGKVRRENQDSFLIERIDKRNCLVAVLCDGMGGEKAGNIASTVASRAFMSHALERLSSANVKRVDIPLVMRQACEAANNMVYGYSCFDSEYTGMGTTLVAAVVAGSRAHVLNVGDSRAYRITKSRITQITKDHSLVQELVDKGEIEPKQMRTHPRRNVITRALGVDEKVPCDLFEVRFNKGDRLLLCSDGLSNMLEDAEILATAKANQDTETLVRWLLAQALDRGAPDNVTAVIISK